MTTREHRERERKLVARCLDGDLAAFDELITEYRSRTYAMLVQMVGNEEDAWDIAQDGFVRAWRSLHTFKGDSSFFTWLFRIMRNLAIDFLRKRRRQPLQSLDAGPPPAAGAATAAGDSPDQRAWQGEIARRIEQALADLSDEHREVAVMREIHGMQYREIAEVAGCSVGTVMSRLYYARQKLRSELQDIYEKL